MQVNVGVQEFHTPRNETEFDLINEVRSILVDLGASVESINAFDTNHYIVTAKPLRAEPQRYLLNEFLRVQFSTLRTNTLDVRMRLIEMGTVGEWLTLFKGYIAPACIHYNLPRSLNG